MPETLKLEPQQAKLTFLLPTTYAKTKSIAQHFRKHKKKAQLQKTYSRCNHPSSTAQTKQQSHQSPTKATAFHKALSPKRPLPPNSAPPPPEQPAQKPAPKTANRHRSRHNGRAETRKRRSEWRAVPMVGEMETAIAGGGAERGSPGVAGEAPDHNYLCLKIRHWTPCKS